MTQDSGTSLSNLLARIHGDGGHSECLYGTAAAVEKADALIVHTFSEAEKLRAAAVRAAAELRHAYKARALGDPADWNLVARAIRILEAATLPPEACIKTKTP